MRKIKVIVTLTVIGGFAGVLLGLTAHYTTPYIDHNRNQAIAAEWEELKSLVTGHLQVIQSDQNLNKDCKLQPLYEATYAQGYGGEMKVLVAFVNSHLVGVRVPYHSETPGYADVLEPDNWLISFSTHKNLAEIDTVSRATITTRTVLEAVRQIKNQEARLNESCGF